MEYRKAPKSDASFEKNLFKTTYNSIDDARLLNKDKKIFTNSSLLLSNSATKLEINTHISLSCDLNPGKLIGLDGK